VIKDIDPAFKSDYIWYSRTLGYTHFRYEALFDDDPTAVLMHTEAMFRALEKLPKGKWIIRHAPTIRRSRDFCEDKFHVLVGCRLIVEEAPYAEEPEMRFLGLPLEGTAV
jgi:hypothetical protein